MYVHDFIADFYKRKLLTKTKLSSLKELVNNEISKVIKLPVTVFGFSQALRMVRRSLLYPLVVSKAFRFMFKVAE